MTSVRTSFGDSQIDNAVGPTAAAIPKFLELALKPILARLAAIEKKLGIEAPEQPKVSTKPPPPAPVPKKKDIPNRGNRVIPEQSSIIRNSA